MPYVMLLPASALAGWRYARIDSVYTIYHCQTNKNANNKCRFRELLKVYKGTNMSEISYPVLRFKLRHCMKWSHLFFPLSFFAKWNQQGWHKDQGDLTRQNTAFTWSRSIDLFHQIQYPFVLELINFSNLGAMGKIKKTIWRKVRPIGLIQ